MQTKKVTCPDCAVLVINNVICHEFGCPSDSRYIGDDDYSQEYSEIENWYPEDNDERWYQPEIEEVSSCE